MQALHGGTIRGASGEPIGAGQTPQSTWIDYSGPVGGGNVAGIAVVPLTRVSDPWWFVTDWGVVTWNPFRHAAQEVPVGRSLALSVAVIAHDGEAGPSEVESWTATCVDMEKELQ